MKDNNRIKIIDNIESKLKLLYKNMNQKDYYEFLNNNKEVKVYNDLLNNITMNNLPTSYLVFLPISILNKINTIVFNELCLFMETKKELIMC
jgi:hypothetical protein